MIRNQSKAIYCLLCVFIWNYNFSQLDTEFWFVAPEVTLSHGDQPVVFRFSSMNEAATILVTQPANINFPDQVLNLPANSAITLDLTPWFGFVENAPSNTVLNFGFRIVSTAPITAYYEVNPACQCNPDIMALKGANALGTSFIVGGQTFYSNGNYQPRADAKFDIVATEDNTTITIIPANDIFGHAAGVPFSILLNSGETFSGVSVSLIGAFKVVGSIITSDKPIAVTYSDDSVAFTSCRDLLSDQLIPTNIIGTEYIAVRGFLNGVDRVFVTAANPATEVFLNNDIVPLVVLNVGETYMIELQTPSIYITTSEPAYVFHVSGFGCEVGGAILPPIVCTGSNIVPFVRSTQEFFGMTILVPAGAEDGFLIDGVAGIITAADFDFVPGTNSEWMYAQIDMSAQIAVGQGLRLENNDERFHLGIINGGASSGCRYGFFSDFSAFKYNIEASATEVCLGGTIEISTNDIPGATYEWTGPNGFTAQGQSISISDLGLDNTGLYIVSGNFPNTCVLVSDSIEISVFPLPELEASYVDLCDGLSLAYNINVVWNDPSNGNAIIAYGDNTSAAVNTNPMVHEFPNAGLFTTTIVATNDFGCVDSVSLEVEVHDIPDVQINSSSFCSTTVSFDAYYEVNSSMLISDVFWIINEDTISADAPTVNTFTSSGDYAGIYGLVATNGCVYNYPFTFFVDSELVLEDFQLPNIITANYDAVNDKFFVDPYFDQCISYTIEFLNRWGQLVYVMNSNDNAFDGKDTQGNELQEGVYFYKFMSDVLELHGFVTIVR